MRTLLLAVVLVLSLALGASAQEPLTSADRAPLRAEAGALLHPTLGFRLRDLGLPQRGPQEIGGAVSAGGTPTSHVWAYSQGEIVVRIVLTASDAPWSFARQTIAGSVRTFARLGASLRAQADEHDGSTALLQHQGRAVMLRGVVFYDGARKFALVVTILHPDAALARAVADSLQVPVEETARALSSGRGLPRSEIRGVIRESIGRVRACYEPRLRDRPELAGRVVVRFLVRADGTVQEASISETTMHDALLEQCVVDVVLTLRFPPRVRGSTPVGVNYPFVFNDGHGTERDTTQRDVTPSGTLSRAGIREVIVESINRVRACYESRLHASPELRGRVVASFIIGADGTVQRVAITETTLHDSEVEQCVAGVIETLRFAAPDGGNGLVGVNYPFVFDSNG